jgi:hypothetical protein
MSYMRGALSVSWQDCFRTVPLVPLIVVRTFHPLEPVLFSTDISVVSG